MRLSYIKGRPTIQVALIGSLSRSIVLTATLDTGADVSLVPASLAERLGINLDNINPVNYTAANGTSGCYYPAMVSLKIVSIGDDYVANLEWNSIVGFSHTRTEPGLIGHDFALTYFDVTFFGSDQCVVLSPNSTFTGDWTYSPLRR